MLFDFKNTYTTLSNEALAQIVANSSGFPPESVAAAKTILEERGITAEEIQQMMALPSRKIIVNNNTAPAIQYEDGQSDIFSEIGIKSLSAQSKKRIVFIAIIWGVLCVINFFFICITYGAFRSNDKAYILGATIGSVISLLPLLFIYMLYKGKKWGWLLSVGYLSFYVVAQMRACLRVPYYSKPHTILIAVIRYFPFITPIAFAMFLVLLYGRQLRKELNIANNIMWRPVIAGVILCMLGFLSSSIA